MKKRIDTVFSLVLVLCMALSSVTVSGDEISAVGESSEAVRDAVGLYEMNFLNSLGIVSFTEGILTQNVTNEEFAGAVGVMSGMTDDYYRDGVLDMLVNGGYLPSACAYPDRSITYSQALKGFVSAFGYDGAAQKAGGYPEGYAVLASKLKLTDGVDITDYDAALTYGEMCIMMYNALGVKRVVQSVYGQSTEYEKEAVILNDVFEIYREYGRVTANSVTSLGGANVYKYGSIYIDGTEFKNSKSAYDDLFGYNVEYYFKKTGGSYELLYMELDESKNKIIETAVNDGSYISGKKLYYYNEGKKKKSAAIADGYCLLYNKRVTSKGLENYIDSVNGYIKMADTDSDGRYDFIEINSYDTIFVSRINTYGCEIFDKYYTDIKASFDDKNNDTKYIIRDTRGNDISFSDIKKGNVVSVIKSEDGKVAFATVSTESKTMIVDSVSHSGDAVYIGSGNERFEVGENAENSVETLSIGEEYKVYFDFMGYAAGFERSDEVFEAGLIAGVETDADNGLRKNNVKIKLFGTDGVFRIFEFAEKVTVDGVKYDKNANARAALYKSDNTTYKSKLILYSVKNEKIVNIDTAYYNEAYESENSLQLVGNEGNKTYSRDGQCFISSDSSGFVFDSGLTVMMTYRTDLPERDESEYNIIKYTDFPSGYSIPNVTGYSTNAKSADIEYVVAGLTQSFATGMRSDTYVSMLFDSITRKKDANGEEKYCINGLQLTKNVTVERLVDDVSKLNGVKRGDIINISFTLGGAVGTVYKAYDGTADKVMFTDSSSLTGAATSTGNAPKMFYGKAFASGSIYVYVLPESKLDTIDKAVLADCKMVAAKRRTLNCYVYDKSADKDRGYFTSVPREDINDYLNTGEGADTVLAVAYASEYSAVVVFRQ